MNLKTRKVLTVNQGELIFLVFSPKVVEILLFFNETQDWAKALEKAVPKRKGGVLKDLDNVKDESPIPNPQPVDSNETTSNSN